MTLFALLFYISQRMRTVQIVFFFQTNKKEISALGLKWINFISDENQFVKTLLNAKGFFAFP